MAGVSKETLAAAERARRPAAQAKADAAALDRINEILSDPEWGVGMLEDICELVRGTGRVEVADAEWSRH